MSNPYKLLRDLMPTAPLLVGEVVSVAGDLALIELPGGNRVKARGSAFIGQKVFFRDEVIEGAAPNLPLEIVAI